MSEFKLCIQYIRMISSVYLIPHIHIYLDRTDKHLVIFVMEGTKADIQSYIKASFDYL